MYARCPGCSTVHPVNAAALAQKGGQFRCGKCNKVSNALDSLFDDWPEAGAKPAPKGELPLLGLELDLGKAGNSRLNPEDAGLAGDYDLPAHRPSRLGRFLLRAAWLVGGVLVGAFIIIKAAEFAGHPVVEPGEIDEALVNLGIREPAPKPVFRDLDLIHLVSRELAADPADPGVLRLQATIVNRASKSQPYPDLEVILLDAEGEALASYDFGPVDYLSPGAGTRTGMSPHAYLPLSLELDDPGERAVGFELNFR